MDEQEIKLLMDGIAAKNGEAIRTRVQEETKSLRDAVEAQGIAIRQGGGIYSSGDSLSKIVSDQVKNLQGLVTGERRSVKFNVPVGSVNKTLVTRATVNANTMGYRLTEVGQLATIEPIISTLFRHEKVGPSSNGIIRYYDQVTATRGAAWVAEGMTKPESAVTWSERSLAIQKVADSIPVTKEALADVYFIESEIRRLLTINLALKIDDSLYDGTGVTPEIKGVYTSAPAFVTTPYADTVEGATLYDLILVVAADISADRGAKYKADTVLLNPGDVLRLKTLKNSQGNYIGNPFANEGIRLVESSQVTPNTMVVGDFRYGTIYDLEDVVIEMGYINDQFIKNTVTILAEQRLALLIRTGDETAFRKVTDITTALGDLETP